MSVRVQLRRDAHRVARAQVLWLERRQISKIQGPPDPRELAQVVDSRGRELGWGLYAPDAKILVRMLSWDPAPLPADWLRARVHASLRRREGMGLSDPTAPTTGYREINSEGDGLPGLVVDRYGDHRVLQITGAAMDARADLLLDALQQFAPAEAPAAAPSAICVRPESAATREGFTAGVSGARPEELSYLELGLRFECPAPPTQKTGAYHDQRDNRSHVAQLAAQDGRPLLDLGCHVGGFSVHAAARGCDAVAVDQSQTMLSYLSRNAAALGAGGERAQAPGQVTPVRANIFAPLDDPALRVDGGFGTVVFDPPKIANNPRELPRARKAMTRALTQCVTRMGDAGLLVVCSCSHHLDADQLDSVVEQAATNAGRTWEPIERRGAGADHPIAPKHPQGEYLRVNLYRVN